MSAPSLFENPKVMAVVVGVALFSIVLTVNIEVVQLEEYLLSNQESGSALIATSFSMYVLGLLATLIVTGGLADKIGSRRVVMAAIVVSFISLALLCYSRGFTWIAVSRILRGVSVGLILGSSAKALIYLLGRSSLSSNLHGVLVTLGLGSGGIYTLLFGFFYSTPLVPAISLLMLIQAIIFFMLFRREEISANKNGVTFVSLPSFISSAPWPYFSIFLAWSFVGLMITSVSNVFKYDVGDMGSAFIIFLAVSSGAMIQPFFRAREIYSSLYIGLIVGVLALFFLIFSYSFNQSWAAIFSAFLCGMSGLGVLYTVSLRKVMSTSGGNDSGLMSGFFLSGYLGLGIPCIFFGMISDFLGLKYAFYAFASYYVFVILIIILMVNYDDCKREILTQ